MDAEPLVTPPAQPPATVHRIRRDLARIAARIWMSQLLLGGCWWLATASLLALALFVTDNLLHLPAALRLVLLLGGIALASHGLWRHVIAPARSRWSPERAARVLERHGGRRDNLLINACLFESAMLGDGERAFIAPVMLGARSVMRATPLWAVCEVKRVAWWGAAAVAMLASWTAYHWSFPDRLDNAWLRFVLPLGDVPALGSVRLHVDPERDLTCGEGQSLVVHVTTGSAHAVGAPRLVWQDGASTVAIDGAGGESIVMSPERGPVRRRDGPGDGAWRAEFADLRRSFAFRVICDDSCSPSVHVSVAPLPRLTSCQIRVVPPGYIGGAPIIEPGPPATLSVLAGSQLVLSARLDHPVPSLRWRLGSQLVPCQVAEGGWTATALTGEPGDSDLLLPDGRVLAHGVLQIQPDASPQISLAGVDDNRLFLPDTALDLRVEASDDHGLAGSSLWLRDGEAGAPALLKRWSYLGPPGPPTASERWKLSLDPARFLPGHSYLLDAQAVDWAPGGHPGHSKPMLLRIKSLAEIASPDPALAAAVDALKEAIAREREAIGLSDNLAPDLTQAIASGRLSAHRDVIAGKQRAAQAAGRAAIGEFTGHGDVLSAHHLTPLVEGEMERVLASLAELPQDPAGAERRLAEIEKRQQDILSALIGLLGSAVERAGRRPASAATSPIDSPEHSAASRDAVSRALVDLQDFVRQQERILERSRSLMDAKPLDLSDQRATVTGELAREEAKEAAYLEEKMTDFSKLPTQDFADGSQAKELNQVWQDVSTADAALYQKAVEMAVPQEQQGLELAKELENNLEKWLSNHPDNVQWKMEEALQTADVPVSELPKELEDIVGDLLDKEDAMQPDVEDFSSAWMDNIDKGAGWDASDGPISNMSAKGITGNQLPNQDEIGGRSGEGRNGRSHGQMVQDSAEGKGGRETPSRLDPGAFEPGSVKDSAKDDQGGPTGGGKVSGSAAEGLRGPVPPPLQQAMQRLAGKQAAIRQQAGTLALELRRRHLSGGDLETAMQAMDQFASAAGSGHGGAIHQHFAEAVDALRAARDTISDAPSTTRHERIDLTHQHRDIQQGGSEGVPVGYEDMSSEYFKALAGQAP